jgi:hypothetical protein
MPKYRQDDGELCDSIGLLISILVRYPEIGTVKFDPDSQTLKLSFLLSQLVDENEYQVFADKLCTSLETYNMLEGYDQVIIKTALSSFDQLDRISVIEVDRDVHTLSKTEIALIITLLKESYTGRMIVDKNDSLLEEDLLVQEELIDNMLEHLKLSRYEKKLIGIREDGRVMVFNK